MEMKQEWGFFFYSILYGAEIMTVYDFIRAARRTWKHGKILIAAEDLIFWLASGIFLFTRVYLWNYGILRWYFFVGLLGGILLYAVAISPTVVKIVSFFLKRLKMFFLWVNILVKRVTGSFIKILRNKNGEDVKPDETETARQKGESAK